MVRRRARGLIVIDECSMVDAELGRDLLSFGKTDPRSRRSRATAAREGRRFLYRGPNPM